MRTPSAVSACALAEASASMRWPRAVSASSRACASSARDSAVAMVSTRSWRAWSCLALSAASSARASTDARVVSVGCTWSPRDHLRDSPGDAVPSMSGRSSLGTSLSTMIQYSESYDGSFPALPSLRDSQRDPSQMATASLS